MADPLALLQPLVQKVTIDSSLLPQIELDDPFNSSGVSQSGSNAGSVSAGSWLLQAISPSVTIYTPAGPVSYAPFGTPTYNYWGLIWPGLLITGLLAVYGGYQLVKNW